MADHSLLDDLIARWEAARERGAMVSPEELCQDCPQYLEPLRSAIVKRQGDQSPTVSLLDTDTDPTQSLGKQGVRPVADPATHYRPGQLVAGFTLLREIGRGGFGQVFETEDSVLRRKVAIKFLHSKALEHPAARAQFLAEARAMAAISNDHVVPIYQVGQDRENLYLVMPLLAGETLAAKLAREGILAPDECVRIARELTVGLGAIHAKGLIHRDLKPANIWMEAGTGRVKILDLGLAEEVENLRGNSSAGTPAYMSPEQIEGQSLDFRSDLFSLGAILYQCLTARRAFPGQSLSETINAVLRTQPLPVNQINPAAPSALRELVATLLQKDRRQRPLSAQAVTESLPQSSATGSRPADLPPRQSSPPPTSFVGRHWTRWAVGAVVLACVGLAIFGLRGRPNSSSPTARESLPPLVVEQLEVTPLQPVSDEVWRELPPLNGGLQTYMTTKNAIDVRARLSRPAYCYLLLYRSDGEHVLLFPRGDDTIPPLTDRPSYPPANEHVAYQLNDGPGVWAVCAVASDQPLPSYQQWQATQANDPWEPHGDPQQLASVLIDDGQTWSMPTRGGGLARSSRGEIKISGRARIKPLVDWWSERTGGAVKALAFPVIEE